MIKYIILLILLVDLQCKPKIEVEWTETQKYQNKASYIHKLHPCYIVSPELIVFWDKLVFENRFSVQEFNITKEVVLFGGHPLRLILSVDIIQSIPFEWHDDLIDGLSALKLAPIQEVTYISDYFFNVVLSLQLGFRVRLSSSSNLKYLNLVDGLEVSIYWWDLTKSNFPEAEDSTPSPISFLR